MHHDQHGSVVLCVHRQILVVEKLDAFSHDFAKVPLQFVAKFAGFAEEGFDTENHSLKRTVELVGDFVLLSRRQFCGKFSIEGLNDFHDELDDGIDGFTDGSDSWTEVLCDFIEAADKAVAFTNILLFQ
jgi:hypothetical protein